MLRLPPRLLILAVFPAAVAPSMAAPAPEPSEEQIAAFSSAIHRREGRFGHDEPLPTGITPSGELKLVWHALVDRPSP